MSKSSHHIRKVSVHSNAAMIEHHGTRAREYMNDPDGNILSPPKLKHHDTSIPNRKSARIGRHDIVLTTTEFLINAYSLHVDNYEHGLQFFQALTEPPDELDSLDEALRQGHEDWDGIPNWVINPSEVTAQASASGIRDV